MKESGRSRVTGFSVTDMGLSLSVDGRSVGTMRVEDVEGAKAIVSLLLPQIPASILDRIFRERGGYSEAVVSRAGDLALPGGGGGGGFVKSSATCWVGVESDDGG